MYHRKHKCIQIKNSEKEACREFYKNQKKKSFQNITQDTEISAKSNNNIQNGQLSHLQKKLLKREISKIFKSRNGYKNDLDIFMIEKYDQLRLILNHNSKNNNKIKLSKFAAKGRR